jgi:PAS domain S-box-containing protein
MNSLHRLGELWKKTFINSPIGIAIVSTTGKFVMVNNSLCESLCYTEEELCNYRWQDLTHPEDLLQESALIFDIATRRSPSILGTQKVYPQRPEYMLCL